MVRQTDEFPGCASCGRPTANAKGVCAACLDRSEASDNRRRLVDDLRAACEAELVLLVRDAPENTLEMLWHRYGIEDCESHQEIFDMMERLPCPCRRSTCDCPAMRRLAANRPKERRAFYLPYRIVALIAAQLWPEEYAEPPLPEWRTAVGTTDLKADIMADRMEAGRGLYHPDDFLQRVPLAFEVYDDYGRPVTTHETGNGTKTYGVIRDKDEAEPLPEVAAVAIDGPSMEELTRARLEHAARPFDLEAARIERANARLAAGRQLQAKPRHYHLVAA